MLKTVDVPFGLHVPGVQRWLEGHIAMKKICILYVCCLLLLCIFALYGCKKDEVKNTAVSSLIQPDNIEQSTIFINSPEPSPNLSASYAPYTYYSFEEFEEAVRSSKEDDMYNLSAIKVYYLPKYFLDVGKLDAILVKDVYISIYYYLSEIDQKSFATIEERESAIIRNKIKLAWTREEEAELLLNGLIENLGLIEYSNGLFYFDITFPTESETVLAKSFFWLSDGIRFNLDIPIEIFDNIPRDDVSIIVTALAQVVI